MHAVLLGIKHDLLYLDSYMAIVLLAPQASWPPAHTAGGPGSGFRVVISHRAARYTHCTLVPASAPRRLGPAALEVSMYLHQQEGKPCDVAAGGRQPSHHPQSTPPPKELDATSLGRAHGGLGRLARPAQAHHLSPSPGRAASDQAIAYRDHVASRAPSPAAARPSPRRPPLPPPPPPPPPSPPPPPFMR